MTYYYIKNAFGDIIAIRDSSGNIDSSYRYGAFGECTAGRQGVCYAVNPFRYRGYFYDVETKMCYLKNRYYNPAWHRFMNPDHPDYIDVETVHGLNLYMYCGNDPINNIDPTGNGYISLLIFLGIGAVIGGTIGGIVGYNKDGNVGQIILDIAIGASIGIAGAGLALAVSSAFVIVFHISPTFLGVPVARAAAFGLAAYNIIGATVAPLIGIKMEMIEWGGLKFKPQQNDNIIYKSDLI